jgi:hypothetical protein
MMKYLNKSLLLCFILGCLSNQSEGNEGPLTNRPCDPQSEDCTGKVTFMIYYGRPYNYAPYYYYYYGYPFAEHYRYRYRAYYYNNWY